MINKIIRFSVKNKAAVFFLTALVIVWGFVSFSQLPIDAVPDITNNQVQVNTAVPGWSAADVERTITHPVESAVRGIPNAAEIRSISRLGLSQITIIFGDDMDPFRARQLVSERLRALGNALPEGVSPQLGPISTGLGEVFSYVVEFKEIASEPVARQKQLTELRTIQDWLVKPRMSSVAGVAEINTIGGFERQINIKPDPKKLSRYGISFADIENAVKGATQNIGGGYIEQDAEQFVVQAVGFLESEGDILAIPIKTLSNFDVITIGDVAKVAEGRENRSGAATYNGRESVLGTVMMMTGENSRRVAELAGGRIAEIGRSLPDGVEIIPVYSRSDLVNATTGTVRRNIISGAIFVMIILFMLAGNIRAALITALTIPLALFITIISMNQMGISGNLMSLGALDFGIIIDGVVIVVDHCMRRLKEKKGDTDEIVIEAATEIRNAAGFGQLILLVVFLPIFALAGIEAKTFQPMAATFIIALMGALALSLTLAPALIAYLLDKNRRDDSPRIMTALELGYRRGIAWILGKTNMAIAFASVLICSGVILFARLGAEFIPQLQEGAFAFHLIRPQNISLSASADMQEKAEKVLMSFPEVERVFSRIGTAEMASDPMGVNVSDTYVILKNFGQGVDFEKLTEDMLAKLKNDVPGQNALASQPIQMRFNELLEGSRADLTIKIFGDDLSELEELGEKVEGIIKPISPESDVEFGKTGNFPVFTIEPNLAALKRYGVSKAAVLELVKLALSGAEVGYFFDRDKRFPIVIRLDENERADISIIKKLPVPIFADATVPLAEIADVGFKNTFASINRDDGRRRATIMVNIRGMDTQTFVERAQAAVARNLKLPEGYYLEWGGRYKNLQAAGARFAVLIPLTLIIVFFMIYMAFGSVLQTSLVFMGIPFAVSGGIISLHLAGLPFSISAAVGFIALLGIAVLNSIVLINGFNSIDGNLQGRVVEGSVSRLRAVLMTATTDVLGFIPMAISTGIGSEVQRPLALVIIGGITTSTILTLVVMPAVFYMIYRKMNNKRHSAAV